MLFNLKEAHPMTSDEPAHSDEFIKRTYPALFQNGAAMLVFVAAELPAVTLSPQ